MALPSRSAQDNYEIQVYGSETVAPERTMVELHTNFTFSGCKGLRRAGLPDAARAARNTWRSPTAGIAGLRPVCICSRVIVHLRLPMGRRPHPSPRASTDDLELARGRKPLDGGWLSTVALQPGYMDVGDPADHRQGAWKWYLAFNPTLDRSFHGPSVSQGVTFSPNFKAGMT